MEKARAFDLEFLFEPKVFIIIISFIITINLFNLKATAKLIICEQLIYLKEKNYLVYLKNTFIVFNFT